MKLLEVVVADKTDPAVTATGFALGKKMKKIAVRAGVCDGFIGNRILSHYQKAMFATVLARASPFDVDRALTGFGLARGPFAVSDLAGLDIGWANRKRLAETRDPRETYAAFADRICERGDFGRKTGKGFYTWSNGKPQRVETEPSEQTLDTLQDRLLAPLLEEVRRVLDEGIVASEDHLDLGAVFGSGFAPFRGGPCTFRRQRPSPSPDKEQAEATEPDEA